MKKAKLEKTFKKMQTEQKIKKKRCIVCGKGVAIICLKDWNKMKQEIADKDGYIVELEIRLDSLLDSAKKFLEKSRGVK